MSTFDFECPSCHTVDTVLPYGPRHSPVLIIGDHPGPDELRDGKPFVGATGGVLRSELGRVKLDINRIRMTNLWLHAPNNNDGCLEFGAKQAIKEGMNRKVILLIGSDTVKYFTGLSVSEYNGLIVPCQWFPHAVVVVSLQPATVFHGTVGEIRFALQTFADVIKKELGNG